MLASKRRRQLKRPRERQNRTQKRLSEELSKRQKKPESRLRSVNAKNALNVKKLPKGQKN